jgi:tRNA(Ile)-lysidine synthase TilS/MesJ
VQDFNMIQDGDKIAVGLSGGKDSILLLYALKRYQQFSMQKFELSAITIDMGFKGFDSKPLLHLCHSLDIPYNIISTQIGEIIFHVRKESHPCSLCANMRRGALTNGVMEMGYNKLALGHHSNDAVETLLMSMFYEGRISTFSPVTYFEDKNISIIRPFVYLQERDIAGAVRRLDLPIVKNPCPVDKNTNRQLIKDYLYKLQKDIPDIRDNLLGAVMNTEQVNLWDIEKIRNMNRR